MKRPPEFQEPNVEEELVKRPPAFQEPDVEEELVKRPPGFQEPDVEEELGIFQILDRLEAAADNLLSR